ncbi:MAG: ribonuclease P protein component [Pseudomonadota bacterium]
MPPIAHTFPRNRRLLNRTDFRQVFQQPWKSSDALFTVLAGPATADCPRLGLAIARKQLKSAVDRNRVKRLVREYFRQHTVATLDYVVMARTAVHTRTNAQAWRSLAHHFRQLATHSHRSA